MRLAFLISIFLLGFVNGLESAQAEENERQICGQIDAYDPQTVRLVRRAIYQPGLEGGYFSAGRTYILTDDSAKPMLDALKRYHGQFVCVRGFDSLQDTNSWVMLVTAIN